VVETLRGDCVSGKQVDPKEVEKELKEFLGKKFGNQVHLAGSFPFAMEQPDAGGKSEGGEREEEKPLSIEFDLKPEELETYLNQYVVKQEEAKEVLATKICTHYNRINLLRDHPESSRYSGVGQIKSNILMLGPTGVGKTYLIKLIAARIGIPIVKGDATKFSEVGYVGGDVEDLVRDLVREAGGDIRLAEHGIVYIDEIDKIASSSSAHGPDVSRTGVQRGLLKPMEETSVDMKVPHDAVSQMEALEDYRRTGKRESKSVNTRNILFILSGAFNGLEEIVRRRLSKAEIGFRAEKEKESRPPSYYLRQAKAEDFIAYGYESEFVGRLPVTVVLDNLAEEDLYQILRNPNCPVVLGKRADFKAYGIDIFFEDEALRKLAALAFQEGTGARGLTSVVESTLIKFEKKLPSTDIRRLVVTPETVDDPAGELEALLSDPDDPSRRERFEVLAGREREAFARALSDRAGEFEKLYGFHPEGGVLDMTVQRMIDQGTDEEEAVRYFSGLLAGVEHFISSFREKHSLAIEFTAAARDRLLEKAATEGDAEALCRRLFVNYPLGLQLLHEKTGKESFELDREAVDEPDAHLDRMIKENYKV
jgi:endopeptidase Clp ATP-binding regulatory subunit ClpX